MSNTAVPKFLGRYEIVRELGKGAMGVVYEGRDPNIGRRVAIKTMRKDVMESSGRAEEMLERFLREAQAAGLLNHPNIITIYDAGEEGNTAYIAMEFVEGASLRHLLDERKILDAEEIVEMGATICEALAAAHDQGIVHRDVKPDNILLPTNGALKVADFGIARVSNSNLTQDGELIGTPYYMSPEQFTGQKLDGRSDLFSVAVILYEMLTGEKPFLGEALTAMMHNVINTSPIPPQKLNFSIPNPLGDVIMKALSKRPPERYADGRAMAKALRECMKPNPNPTILGLAPSASSTVMSGSGFGSGGDTQIGGAQGSQMHATLAGAPPASILMDELNQGDSTLKSREQNAVHTPSSTKKLMLPLITGAVALLAVLAGGAFFMLGGEQKVSEGDKGSVTNADIFSSVPLAATTFYIYGTDDKELYKSFVLADPMSLTKEDRGDWEDKFGKPFDDALITVTHKGSKADKTFTDHTAIELPEDLSDFTIKVGKKGYVEESMDAVSFQGDQRILVVALLKEVAQ